MTAAPTVSRAAAAAPKFRMQEAPPTFLRLNLNESPLGPSPKAMAALRDASVSLYPSCGALHLRKGLALRYGVEPNTIACGQGSEELIRLLCRAFLNPGDEAVHEPLGFGVFPAAVAAAGGRPIAAGGSGLRFDAGAIMASIGPRTRMVLLANPNNPTGVTTPWRDIFHLLADLPPRVLLVHDAAYAEYVANRAYAPGHHHAPIDRRLIVLRTFSKAHGLAGLRIGWMHAASSVIDAIDAIRPLYNVSGLAEAAALGSLEDPQHADRAKLAAQASGRCYQRAARDLGVTAIVGDTNFVCLPHAPGLAAAYTRAAIAVHTLGGYHLPHGVRISFGTKVEDRRAIAVLRSWARAHPAGPRAEWSRP